MVRKENICNSARSLRNRAYAVFGGIYWEEEKQAGLYNTEEGKGRREEGPKKHGVPVN
jgi:hypothetical protein